MQQSLSADKYIVAVKKTRIKPIRGRWTTQSGACPLYIWAYSKLKRVDETVRPSDTSKVLPYMLNMVGLDYRNGFTAAIDLISLDDFSQEEKTPHFLKGYDEGEYVVKQLNL